MQAVHSYASSLFPASTFGQVSQTGAPFSPKIAEINKQLIADSPSIIYYANGPMKTLSEINVNVTLKFSTVKDTLKTLLS